MRRQYIKWYSPSLHRDMELMAFGENGFPAVVFPTSGGRFHEHEDRGMVNAVRPGIESDGLQVICLDSVDAYLVREVAPFVQKMAEKFFL